MKEVSKFKIKNSLNERIYEVVSSIPQGKVMTYGQIAYVLNLSSPRIVGWVLHRNPDSEKTPCHRVVFADGCLSPGYAFGGWDRQYAKLKSEGVAFTQQNKVDLQQSLLK